MLHLLSLWHCESVHIFSVQIIVFNFLFDPLGLNAQARKLQHARSRVTSLFVDGTNEGVDALGIWRSLSEMDVSTMGKEASETHNAPQQEDPEAEADKEAHRLNAEKEETESSDDNNTQYSIHLPFDFPYFLLLQGYSHRQVGQWLLGPSVMLLFGLGC